MSQSHYTAGTEQIESGLHTEFEKERDRLESAFDSIKTKLEAIDGVSNEEFN